MAENRSDVTADVIEGTTEEEIRVCLFSIGEDAYAIPVEVLTEIIIPQKLFPVPTTPGHVLGVINLRGNIIPIVDIRPILSLSQKNNVAGQIAILKHHQVPLGIVVDVVVEVASIPKSRFLELPAELAAQQPGKSRNRFLQSIIQREGGAAALLDIEKVLDEIKLA